MKCTLVYNVVEYSVIHIHKDIHIGVEVKVNEKYKFS